MNPKIKAVLISLVFFPLVVIGQFISIFANDIFQMFYSFIDFDFSYGEFFVVGIAAGLITGEGLKRISKENNNFWHLTLLPIIVMVGMSLVLFIFDPIFDIRMNAINLITLITYICIIKSHTFAL